MKFEAGSFYKTRGGRKAIVYAVYEEGIHGAVYQDYGIQIFSWNKNGHGWYKAGGDDTLVSEWKEPLKFECKIENMKIERGSYGYVLLASLDKGLPLPEGFSQGMSGKLTFEETA